MPYYRRLFVPGGTYFFTVVTHSRRPILTTPVGRTCLRQAIDTIRRGQPFEMLAVVLLPDHLHTVWELPPLDDRYPRRWRRIKELFTRSFLAAGGTEEVRSASSLRHRERAVWQRRYWEHLCGDEDDRDRCLDYIHWNPVKHGLVARPADYPWSTFRRYIASGHYDPDWGAAGIADVPGAEWE